MQMKNEDKNDSSAGKEKKMTKPSKRIKCRSKQRTKSSEEDADQQVEKPESDTTTGMVSIDEEQTREHTHIEQLKTAMSVIDMGDESENVTSEIETLGAKP